MNWIDPSGYGKHSPDSAYCINLKKKIQNLQKEIRKRYDELEEDKLKLPKVKKGTKLYETIKGHEILLTQARRRYYELLDKYDQDCGGGNDGENESTCSENDYTPAPSNKKHFPWWLLLFGAFPLGSLATP